MNFENLEDWTLMIISKLQNGADEEKAYVETYFWSKVCDVNKEEITHSLKYYFRNGLKNKNSTIIEQLEAELRFEEEHPWWKVFEEQLKEFPEIVAW